MLYLVKSKYVVVKNSNVFSSYIPAAARFNVKLACRYNSVCPSPLQFLEKVLPAVDLCVSDTPE